MNARKLFLAGLGGALVVAGAIVFVISDDDADDDGVAGRPPAGEVSAIPAPAGAPTDGPDAAERGDGTLQSAVPATGPSPVAAGSADDAASTPPRSGDPRAPVDPSPAQSGPRTIPPSPADERPATEPPPNEQAANAQPATDQATPAPRQEIEEILRATSRRYEGVRALQSDFRQRLTNTLLGRTTESAGTLYQRQPDRFLMRFSEPAGDMIVSDGDYFWLYYPSVDPRQVIRSARGAGGLDLRSQFVGDPVERFEATSHGAEQVRGRATHVLTLTPREPLGYHRLKVWIDAEDHLVRRFELTEDNGNVRLFDLTDLRVNPTLADDLFEFEPPAGAVIVTR